MKAIILCAGYATRLYPLTKDTPKPLLEVDGMTILDHIMLRLSFLAEIDEVCIITNDRFYPHFSEWERKASYHGLRTLVVNDQTTSNDDRLGSIGDINFALNQTGWNEAFLLINGDNLCTFSLNPAMSRFRQSGHTILTYDVGSLDAAKIYGVPFIDDRGKVTDFVEKPDQPQSAMVSIGVYYYDSETPALIGEYVRTAPSVDKTGDFVAWLAGRCDVYTHEVRSDDGLWFDIGTLEELERARTTIEALHTKPFASGAEVKAAIERAMVTEDTSAGIDNPLVSTASSFLDLIRILAGHDPARRAVALRILGELKIPAAIPWLLDSLADGRPIGSGTTMTVSELATDALVTLGYRDAPYGVRTRAQTFGFPQAG
ncbi:MAG: NTP transferase domain-containing protein [Planctomycetes bacterium]|nr:NTP transferase domain-containing protein [Planctomycetota bacterium]